jgi:peptidoglycan/LPS O-acetylase OafA/YrhL
MYKIDIFNPLAINQKLMPPLSSKPHYPILDGLRGVASLTVVAMHLCEALSTSHLDMVINHGYLAVDFFFLLSGFVIGYAYDDRWGKMSTGSFFKRRLIRLQPLVVLGSIIGAACFYFQDSAMWPTIHTVPVATMLLVMLIGCTLIPIPISMDIRGWQEMHPLDGPAWSLFFEYIANILYATVVRRFSNLALSILVGLAGAAVIHYAVTGGTGDLIGGWSLDALQLRIGFTRLLYPFFAGLLLFRITKRKRLDNAFFWCSLLLLIVLALPRIGGADHLWLNGLYESMVVIVVFPFIVWLGAGGVVTRRFASRICKFFGDISYPLYITHYPFIYIFTGWVSNHKGVGFAKAFPYMLATYAGALIVAYAALKLYDEPVRKWLNRPKGINLA